MKQSNFRRNITDFTSFENQLQNNDFLQIVYRDYVQQGTAMLTFRDEEATIYYHGNQLCNLKAAPQQSISFLPTIYNRYLPLFRSQVISTNLKAENYLESTWLEKAKISGYSYSSVLPEILDNIKKDSSPESTQVSRFYEFSPLNCRKNSEILLLDVEAAFSCTGEKTDRIDAVFYHTGKRRLMFVEVKRLSDSRVQEKKGAQAEVIQQMKGYQDTIRNEKTNIIAQYNCVIDYYNKLSKSKKQIPAIADVEPLLGLLLVEFTSSQKDQEKKKAVISTLKQENFNVYAIGNTNHMTEESTLAAIYSKFEKV